MVSASSGFQPKVSYKRDMSRNLHTVRNRPHILYSVVLLINVLVTIYRSYTACSTVPTPIAGLPVRKTPVTK